MGHTKRYAIIPCVLSTLLLLGAIFAQSISIPSIYSLSWSYPSGFDPHGPYIDILNWVVYVNESQALVALQNGDVNGYDARIRFDQIPFFEAIPGIGVSTELSTSYRQFNFNTLNFPCNITEFRRALAFALDKRKVCINATGGLATPMDGAIPISNTRYTYEFQITNHYYDPDIIQANATLEAAKFRDLDGDGWREYDVNDNYSWDPGIDVDDGDKDYYNWNKELHCSVIVNEGNEPAIQAAKVLIEGMTRCGLRASLREYDFFAMVNPILDWKTEGRIGCWSWQISVPGEPDLLYDFFYSKSGNNQLFYFYNSSTFDYNATKMVEAPTVLEARGWAWNCSQILLQDMPMITCYNDVRTHVYWDDIWEGYVYMVGKNCMENNPWTHRKLHLREEAGGLFGLYYPVIYREVLTEGMDFTNILRESDQSDQVFMNLYSRLWQVDPYTWEKVPDLAYNWTIQATTTSGDIQDGQKWTFHLYDNITWHDGVPFTSEDVAFNFETIWRFARYLPSRVENLYMITTPDDYTVEIYSNRSGYFEFSEATYLYILPKHIWEAHYPYWNWTLETAEDLTGTGPFRWIERVPGNYILLHRFENYHLGVPVPARPPPFNQDLALLNVIFAIGGIIIVIEVAVLAYQVVRHKGSPKKP